MSTATATPVVAAAMVTSCTPAVTSPGATHSISILVGSSFSMKPK